MEHILQVWILLIIGTVSSGQDTAAQLSQAQQQPGVNPQGSGTGYNQMGRVGLSQTLQQSAAYPGNGNAQTRPVQGMAAQGADSRFPSSSQVGIQTNASPLNRVLSQGMDPRNNMVNPAAVGQSVDKSIGNSQNFGGSQALPTYTNQVSGSSQTGLSQGMMAKDSSGVQTASGYNPQGTSTQVSGVDAKVAQPPGQGLQQSQQLLSQSSNPIQGIGNSQSYQNMPQNNVLSTSNSQSMGTQASSLSVNQQAGNTGLQSASASFGASNQFGGSNLPSSAPAQQLSQLSPASSLDTRGQIGGSNGLPAPADTQQFGTGLASGVMAQPGQAGGDDGSLLPERIDQFITERSGAMETVPPTDASVTGESDALQRAISTLLLDKTSSTGQGNETIPSGTDEEDVQVEEAGVGDEDDDDFYASEDDEDGGNGVIDSLLNWFGTDDDSNTANVNRDGSMGGPLESLSTDGQDMGQMTGVEDVVDQELVNRNKPPTGPSSMVLFYTWMIVTVMLVAITISTCQHRLRGVRLPFLKSRPHSPRDDKRRLTQDYA